MPRSSLPGLLVELRKLRAGPQPVDLGAGSLDQLSFDFLTYGLTANALLGGALVAFAHSSNSSSFFNRLLSTRFMREIGKYSYGIYVLHFPFLRFFGRLDLGLPETSWTNFAAKFSLYIATSILLGGLSWQLLEKHVLKLKRYFVVGLQ